MDNFEKFCFSTFGVVCMLLLVIGISIYPNKDDIGHIVNRPTNKNIIARFVVCFPCFLIALWALSENKMISNTGFYSAVVGFIFCVILSIFLNQTFILEEKEVEKMVGTEIKKHRQRKGFSLKKISELSGVSDSVISDIETGKVKNPGIITILKIAKGLEVDIKELTNRIEV